MPAQFSRYISSFALLCLTTLLFATSASAQTVTFDVYASTNATGCTVTLPSGSNLNGINSVITATVDTGTLMVTDVSIAQCNGVGFDPGVTTNSNFPVGLNNGVGGADVVELSAPFDLLGPRSNRVQLFIASNNPMSTAFDELLNTTGSPGGAAIVVALPFAIPVNSPLMLALMAVLLLTGGYLVIRRRRMITGVSLMLFSSIVIAANFVVDGNVGDWVGEIQQGADPLADTSVADNSVDLAAFFGAVEGANFFARIDVVDLENNPPVANAGMDTTLEDTAVVLTVTGSDIDGDPLTFAVDTPPLNGALGAFTVVNATTSNVTYTPNADFNGADQFLFVANDGQANSTPVAFDVTITPVNDAPVFTVGADETVLEDSGAQTVAAWATGIAAGPATATDETGQVLTFNITANDNMALFSVQPAVAADGTLTYTPAADANGTANITLELMDDGGTANGGVDTSPGQTFAINVTPVNDEPSFTVGADETVLEDAGAQSVPGWATGISAGPPDEAGQVLTFNITANDNPGLFSAGPAVAADGTLTYTPAADANGSAMITLELMDDGGTANGGDDTSPTQSFMISVTAVNDAPEFTAGADETVLEDSGAQTVAGWATGIAAGPATATDETGQVLTFNITANDNMALFSVQPAVATDGTLTYTPAADANGTANITVELMDDGGTANGGVDTSAGQTFAINVTAVNDEPSFTAGPDQMVLEDAGAQSVAGWATGISPGPADEAGQTVSFNITGNTNAGLFAAGPAVDSAGTLTYTPAADANGSAVITLEAMDDGGTANGGDDTSPSQSFMISVTAVNDAPSFIAGADENVLEDSGAQTVAGWATGLSAGPADEAGQTLTFNITGNDNMALFSVQPAVAPDGTLTYTPAPDAFGTANIMLNIMDNGGTANGGVDTSPDQTFAINVTGVNDAPSFMAGPDQMAAVGTGAQSVAGWATGFNPGPANEAGQMVAMYNVTVSTNPGIFAAGPTVANDGTLNYTPVAAIAMDTTADILVSVTDDGGTANGGVDTSPDQMFQITITVPPPALMNDAYAATGNVSLSQPDGAMDLFANDSLFGGTLDMSMITSTNGGDVVINGADGSFTYNPPAGFTGMDTFTYSVTNGSGTSMATVTMTVNDMIWFIDAAATCPCDGRLSNPFTDFGGAGTSFDNNAADSAGDAIFIEQGAYTGGVTLLNNQILVGDGATTTLAGVTGITPAPNSDPLPAFSGVRPVVTGAASDGITLGSGNTMRGLNVGNSQTMIVGPNVGNLTISEVVLSGTGGGIDIANGTAAITFDSITASMSTLEGIDLNTIGGTFTVTGLTDISGRNGATGINIVNSAGTFTFTGGVGIGGGAPVPMLNATGGGTLIIPAAVGGIVNDTGPAININGTTIGTGGIQFVAVSAGNGAPAFGNGISLVNTGTTAGLTVTGSGAPNTGGVIRDRQGADNNDTQGIGIYLENTVNPSFSFMGLDNFDNFAIRGRNVTNFTLIDSDISGFSGTNYNPGAMIFESAIFFENLEGMVMFRGDSIAGGRGDNVRIINTMTTTPMTFSMDDSAGGAMVIGLNSNTAQANDGVLIEDNGNTTSNITIVNTDFLGARGDMLQTNALGNSTHMITVQNNVMINNHPMIVSGGGGVTFSGGSAASTLMVGYDVSNNRIENAVGNALTVNYLNGGGMATGVVGNNTIGNPGVLDSGSLQGAGISIGAAVNVVHNSTVSGNQLDEVVGSFSGMEVVANVEVNMTADINNNVVNIAANPGGFALASFYSIVGGGTGLENGTLCLPKVNNTHNAGAAPNTGHAIFLDQISTNANYIFPGYAGSPNGQFAAMPGTASVDLDAHFAGLGNMHVNGPFLNPFLPPANSTDATIIDGATGGACP